MSKQNFPELRFPEFQEELELQYLGEILDFKNGINADKSQYGRGKKFISVLDVINDSPIYYDSIIGSVDITDKEFDNNDVQYGDVLFQRSSEIREEAGQSNIYLDKKRKATFGGFIIRGRPKIDFNPIYFNYLLKTRFVRKEITDRSGGSTRFNIGQNSLSEVPILISISPEEQEKIASFLGAVDARLTQLRRKQELLQTYKRGVMQKIFSQQIRFTQPDGSPFLDWEYNLAKHIFKSHSNKNHNGDLPILAATQDKGMIPRNEMDIKIRSSQESIQSYKVVEKGDFVISLRSFQGGIEYSEFHGICSPAYTVLKPKVLIFDCFYKYLFKKSDFITRLSNIVVGIRDGKQISYEAFSGLKLPLPCLEEQEQIANFLTAIDRKIETLSRQIEQTEKFKKGLLQKMFV
jgi:type I restriction enzyme, S subunit